MKTTLFHKIPKYGDFVVDGVTYKKISGRKGMDEKGNTRTFVDSQSVSAC